MTRRQHNELNAQVHKQCIRTYYKRHRVIFCQRRESSIDLVAVTCIEDAQLDT